MAKKLDYFDIRILEELQKDSSQSQREISEKVALSQNACWRRIKQLEKSGAIKGRTIVVDRDKLGIGLVVFAMIKTRHHSQEWLDRFRNHVRNIPEVMDFYRIGGEYDYMLKVVVRDMGTYDEVYRRLIEKIDLETVTSFFAMEAIVEQQPLRLHLD